MDTYQYLGRNRRGEPMRGTAESASPQAVANWLMESEIFPVSIQLRQPRAQRPAWVTKIVGQEKVSRKDMLLFTRQMSNMTRAGMQVMDAVQGIERTTGSPPLAEALSSVRSNLDHGVALSEAFARRPETFDDYYVNMVRVGEGTGRLSEAFEALYRQIEFDADMRQKIKAAARYPTFVVVALVVAMTVLTIFVIPQFAKAYGSLKVELPFLTRVLLVTSAIAVGYWWAVLGALGASWYAMRLWLATSEGRYLWDRAKLRIPIAGSIMRKAAVARFSSSFAAALRANVPIVQAFQLASKVVENAFYESRIVQMRKGIERGEILSRVMRTSGIFTPLEIQLIAVAERTGEVEQAVQEVAGLYTGEVNYEVSRLAQTIEPLLLAIMGILVAVIMLGIFLPMWDISQLRLGK
jgi:MSHA biogenesis protein MshG